MTRVPSGRSVCGLALALGGAVALIVAGWAGGAAQAPKPVTAEAVRDLQARYKAERAAAEQAGLPKMFSPDWFGRADALADNGTAALDAGRLLEARESFRKARWQLPSLPPDFPPHVARVFGDSKLRHTYWVQALAYSPDGGRLATASQDGTVKVWDMANGHELRTFTGHG